MHQQNSTNTKPIILVLAATFLPGYRAGGPIRSIANLIEVLSDEFEFHLITSDHDLGEITPYAGIIPDQWTTVGKAQVLYLSRKGRTLLKLWKLIRKTNYDILYLNSFFSRRFSMFPHALWRLGLLKNSPLILAPRGEFSRGALGIKRFRKAVFIKLSTFFKWYSGTKITWQASSELEEKDIHKVWGDLVVPIAPPLRGRNPPADLHNREIIINNAPDIVAFSIPSFIEKHKKPASLSVVFIGRCNRMKNLDFALKALMGIRGMVNFDIFGSIEDEVYWAECKDLIAGLENNIKVIFHGWISHQDIVHELSKREIMFLPTLGENYGHAICEALLAGCPVIISDQTPWRNLQSHGVGWDLPLDDVAAFRQALQECVDMGPEEYSALSRRAINYGLSRNTDEDIVQMNRNLFNQAIKNEGDK